MHKCVIIYTVLEVGAVLASGLVPFGAAGNRQGLQGSLQSSHVIACGHMCSSGYAEIYSLTYIRVIGTLMWVSIYPAATVICNNNLLDTYQALMQP